VLDSVPKGLEAHPSIVLEVQKELFGVLFGSYKAAIPIFELQRKIPVKQGYKGSDIRSDKAINLSGARLRSRLTSLL
jgi:hypothetical protein